MIYYCCEKDWESVLTCIYEAWTQKRGQANIQLIFEPVVQYTLFDEYIHVKADTALAEKVVDAVNRKLSPQFYYEIAHVGMYEAPDVADVLFRVLLLGFTYGPHVLEMVQYKDIMRFREMRCSIGNEISHFREFTRFHEVNHRYVAIIEPRSRIIPALAEVFLDRMPSESWMIADLTNRMAVVHPKDGFYQFVDLTTEEMERLMEIEKNNDRMEVLWKIFFETTAIQERKNERCQKNLYPIWTRKHAVEFMEMRTETQTCCENENVL